MSNMLCKHLQDTGEDWPLYVYPCAMAMNTFVSPITGYSPYEMVFLQPPPEICELEFDPTKVKGQDKSTREYMAVMRKRFEEIKKLAINRRAKLQEAQIHRENRKFPTDIPFQVGDLALVRNKEGSDLQVPSKKFQKPWVGPVKITAILDDTHYIVSDLPGKILPRVIEKNRLKPLALYFGNKPGNTITNYKSLRALLQKEEIAPERESMGANAFRKPKVKKD
jgi:hypothetical protein